MPFIAIMKATPDGRVAKYGDFSTEAEADAHVAAFLGDYPDAFTVPEPGEPFSHWRIDMAAKTLVIDPPTPTLEPTATGAQMIDEAKSRGKLASLLTALTASERATLFTRRRIVGGSNFAEVLRGKLGVSAAVMASFIATAAVRSEV